MRLSQVTKPATVNGSIREANVTAFLDAAERLLMREGAAGISTRQLAAEAGQNHGLVHYYFGSVDELLLQKLERFTRRSPSTVSPAASSTASPLFMDPTRTSSRSAAPPWASSKRTSHPAIRRCGP